MKKPIYNTVTFVDIYDTFEEFLKDYKNLKVPKALKPDSVELVYYLLYSNYGNSPIVYNDINQFRYKLFTLIWQFGPTWERRVEIQEVIRNLSEDELRVGSKQILNIASNPATDPSEQSLEELSYINNQQTNNTKRSKIDAYAQLNDMLRTDVTDSFMRVFRQLFKKFVSEEHPVIYMDGCCEDDCSYEEVDINGTSY